MIKSMPIKLIISFIVIVLLASIFYTPLSHAIGDIMKEGKNFLDASNGENEVINQTALKDTSDSIYNTLLAMAIIIAVIVAMVLGIQFMYAAADEKAKIKEALMPFIVGCIIVFGSFTIWKVFINMGQSAEDKISTKKTTTTTYSGTNNYKDVNYKDLKEKYGFAENRLELEEINGYYSEKYGEYISVKCKWKYNNSTYTISPAITKEEVGEDAFKKIKENKDKSCVMEYMDKTKTKFNVYEEYTKEMTITISE